MYKRLWKEKSAVSPVIATILMVAITVVLAGVLVVYMQQFSGQNTERPPTAVFVPLPFANPSEGSTHNNGGWSIKVTSITGVKPGWSIVAVNLKTPAGVVYKGMNKVTATSSILSHEGSDMKWYMVPNSAVADPQYNNTGTVQAVNGNEDQIHGEDFQTVEKAYFVVMDNDADGKLTPNDVILIYRDNNADSADDVTGGFTMDFTMSTGIIGSVKLT